MSEAECAAARNEWNQNAGEAVPMVVIEDHKCPFQVVCVCVGKIKHRETNFKCIYRNK